jgi:DNA-directed RNA polymerase subunit RPC12/RpoP
MIACQTELNCLHCGDTTSHTIYYASLYIKRIECRQCSFKIEKPLTRLIQQYVRDLPARAFDMTLRLEDEALAHPIEFAWSLPKRVVHKPIELTREFVEVCL